MLFRSQYVAVCEGCDSAAANYAEAIEETLLQQVLLGLGDEADEALKRVVSHDITLNAQGLAHWALKRQASVQPGSL